MFNKLIFSCLMCVSLNGFADTANGKTTPADQIRSECATLPRPDIPEYSRAYYGSTVYKAATYYIFLENDYSSVELGDIDPELMDLLKKIREPKYADYANHSLEANMKEAMSEVVGSLGKQPDKIYFNKSMICASLNAYTKRGSSENVYVKYNFQQLMDQIDSDPTRKYGSRDVEEKHTSTDHVNGQRISRTSKVTTAAKTIEPTDAKAQFLLGMNYEMGTDVAHDPHRAMTWFLKSAKQGNGQAQFWVASHYFIGDGVEKDLIQAYAWFSASASNGYFPAKNPQGLCSEMLSKPELAAAQALAKHYSRQSQENN